MDENLTREQLEEGEIVDDDDFEDISDNSIIDSAFGKFVSSNEHLRALSLSSGSETDIIKELKPKKRLLRRKSKIKHQKRRKRIKNASESSDSDISPTNVLKGQLKDAIHIGEIEGGHKNTLETRLKAMGGLTVSSEAAAVEQEPAPEAVKETNEENSDKIDDAELENLRLEALKTAVLNKCQRRKRKKALLESQEVTAPQTQENKENNTPKDEQDKAGNDPMDMEEDEDVLRASLLAGLAKKIAKKQTPNENIVQVKQVAPKLPISVVPVLPKQITKFKTNINKKIITNKVIQRVIRPKPQVKPLIINVNADSDSEDDLKPKVAPPPDVNFTSNVEKFLKEQRAKFETENAPNKNKSILEKSAVKLLPKSQQIEYQLLLKRLRNAERRKRAKRLAVENLKAQTVKQPPKNNTVTVEVSEGPTVQVTAIPQPVVEVIIQPVDEERTEEEVKSEEKTSKTSESSEGRKSGITSELTTLQKTLKEIKMQRNGSLQIKSKYQVLTPIIRKITSASNDRKKQEHRIKTLLQELSEARNNLSKSHERFSTLVKELVAKKEKIDESCRENIEKIEISIENNKKETKSVPVTSTPIKSPVELTDEATISTFVTSSTNNEYEDMDVCNSDETDICQIDIVDPNDIDQIFRRKTPVKSTVPEYVSPLTYGYERYRNVDPLGIMCPYEVNGSCRDIDCSYKHYLKINERL